MLTKAQANKRALQLYAEGKTVAMRRDRSSRMMSGYLYTIWIVE